MIIPAYKHCSGAKKTMRTSQELITNQIYEDLRAIGVDIQVLKSLNFSFPELEDFYVRVIFSLREGSLETVEQG
jgi:hypothetical protein